MHQEKLRGALVSASQLCQILALRKQMRIGKAEVLFGKGRWQVPCMDSPGTLCLDTASFPGRYQSHPAG